MTKFLLACIGFGWICFGVSMLQIPKELQGGVLLKVNQATHACFEANERALKLEGRISSLEQPNRKFEVREIH